MIMINANINGNDMRRGRNAWLSENAKAGIWPVYKFYLSIAIPIPRLILKNCPAKQPVIAILASPHLATAALVIVSPTELPQARIVSPK